MINTFKKVKDFTDFTTGGMKSGDLYYVEEDKSIHLRTNNIDGTEKDYSATSSVLVTDTFTENGTYTPEEADGYSSVTVNVPTTSTLITGSFAENGTYTPEEADGYSSVTVDVPSSVLVTGSFTENGTYTPEEADGYSSVTVNVPAQETDYTILPLVIESLVDNNQFSIYGMDDATSITINYSLDEGETWTEFSFPNSGGNTQNFVLLNKGDKVYINKVEQVGNYVFEECTHVLCASGYFKVYGNTANMTHIWTKKGTDLNALPSFLSVYDGNPVNAKLLDASNLILTTDATSSNSVYRELFREQTLLTKGPKIINNITSANQYGFDDVFYDCPITYVDYSGSGDLSNVDLFDNRAPAKGVIAHPTGVTVTSILPSGWTDITL